MRPSLSVVVASLNGASGIRRCLAALASQGVPSAMELIVVDDGSVDATSDVALISGAQVIRHEQNRGVSAARNSGIRVATADIVAFLDDDCEPEHDWAERVIAAHADGALAVGGALAPGVTSGVILGYVARRDPLAPQELELARSSGLPYRLWLYIRRQWRAGKAQGRRQVLSVPAASMSVRRDALVAVGGFDERIRFGSEDEDLCRRLLAAFPAEGLIFDPDVRVTHHFEPSLRDLLRRSRAYGQGSAMMFHKWPGFGPTFFPFPLVLLAAVGLSFRFPFLIPETIALPLILYPRGIRLAVANRRIACVADAYLQALEEASDDIGFLEGLWLFRHFRPGHRDKAPAGTRAAEPTASNPR
jgi:glycosyltransferase involved in cell wall biosynthesis